VAAVLSLSGLKRGHPGAAEDGADSAGKTSSFLYQAGRIVVRMKNPVLAALVCALIGCSMTALGQNSTQYQTCMGWFALCTTATCGAPKPNESSATYTCRKCKMYNGNSVMTLQTNQTACLAVTGPQPAKGTTVQSRFAMTTGLSLVTCTNNNVWANCLDATCTVDANTHEATCKCPSQSSPQYVWGTSDPNNTKQKGCTGDPVISSESKPDADQIGEYWKTQKLLPFVPVLPPKKK